jgi:hypothetical protein
MSQIRSDILYHRQKKKAKELDTKIQHLHIAVPIVEDDNLKNLEFNNLTEDDLQVSDEDNDTENRNQGNRNNNLVLNEPTEPYTEEQEQEWNTFVQEWIEAINNENKFDHIEDEILLTDEMDNDFNFGGRVIHPADDLTAKWLLAFLFVSDLESPTYLGADQIYSAL